jgi:hypothetical protein
MNADILPILQKAYQDFDLFPNVLTKRIPADCIEPETARKMVLKSGGVMRELVRIGRECCTECMVQLELEPDLTDLKINDEILTVALDNLRNDFARQILLRVLSILACVGLRQRNPTQTLLALALTLFNPVMEKSTI